MEASISVWVGNLGKYNEGELVGEWFALPRDDFEQDWADLMKRIHIGEWVDPNDPRYGKYEEVFCADWECEIPGLEYSEYPDYEELNRIAEEWDGMRKYEQEAMSALMEVFGDDYEYAKDHLDDTIIWYGCTDMTDVAHRYVDECNVLHNMPDELANYFDYEAYGRNLDATGNFGYSENLCCMVEVIR